ncbi:MAG: Crp/Fnr family transcriptional regulator [Acidobacteria bacterium]|nr:MAG: Crp/Fnr family transcriptional regulator [Acidobacteriota bacterium]
MVRRRRYPNSILQSLPSSELASISPELRDIDLSKGTLLFEPDTPSTNVYFPINSVISFIGDTGEGGSLEVWAVGSEGLAGVSGILGRTKPFRGVVQVSGNALVAKAAVFRRNFQRCSAFHDAIIGYLDHLLMQISYLGICNNSHPIEQRLCRWLLMIHDRSRTDDLKFTQDGIAAILGTRRATISVAAAALQSAGLIQYTPGSIRIRSRKGLERAACRCYKLINSGRL